MFCLIIKSQPNEEYVQTFFSKQEAVNKIRTFLLNNLQNFIYKVHLGKTMDNYDIYEYPLLTDYRVPESLKGYLQYLKELMKVLGGPDSDIFSYVLFHSSKKGPTTVTITIHQYETYDIAIIPVQIV
jgi:hypothetical protein